MKIASVLQVLAVLYQDKVVNAIYGFGDEPEDPKRIRIYLEDDEKLLVPKDSKVEYINPVIDLDEDVSLDKQPIFSTYVTKVIKKPTYLPQQSYYSQHVPAGLYDNFASGLEDLQAKRESIVNYFGGYLGGHEPAYGQAHSYAHSHTASLQSEIGQSPFAYGKVLRPILLLPNGWLQGAHIQRVHKEKPVTEEQPDDLKFDFRTNTHSLR